MSGFGLTAMTGAAVTAGSPPVSSVPSVSSPSEVTASQFASMLVALLGGDTGEENTRPIARLEEEEKVGDPTEQVAQLASEDAARALHYGLLVDDLRPMSPSAIAPASEQAAAAALIDPPVRTTGDRTVTVPSRDMDALTPEFRSRLDRVIDRMRNEFGHDVQLVETARSPERQAWLFAQGRTRPGPVVTWTQQSAHLTGDAADVIVDGQWRNDQAYARLHRIANEEGLRTLGARDPGHLELPAAVRDLRVQLASAAPAAQAAQEAGAQLAHHATARATARAHRAARALTATADGAAGTGSSTTTVASRMMSEGHGSPDASIDTAVGVPAVAAPAAIASVATVARVARPGVSRSDSNGERVDSDLTLAHGSRARRRGDRDAHEGGQAFGASPQPSTVSTIAGAEESTGRLVGNIDRVDRTTAIAGRSPREVAQLTLALDGGNGQRDDITIGVRGASVGATIATTDGAMADRLRDNVIDLRKALESRGLGMDEFRAESRRLEGNDPTHALATSDRDAVRVRTMSDAGASFLSRDGQDESRGQGDERRPPREQRQHGDAQQSQQDQRERQGAARDHAARVAAFRRSGRPIQGDHVA